MPQRKRKELEQSARLLRERLNELESRPITELDRPVHEVALQALRESLTRIGRQLALLSPV